MRGLRRALGALLALVVSLSPAGFAPAVADPLPSGGPLLGFDAPGAAAERALEAAFDASLDPVDQRAWMKRLSARSHHVGFDKGARSNARTVKGWSSA
jgi:N-acetylated-alpha-linked acidic dipeptidase